MIKRFNIRVYGILEKDGTVLITDEIRGGTRMTKFPGGGLEFGEGVKECLIREFKEELGVTISVGNVIYVNEFFQASAFNPEDQLVSMYFRVDLLEGVINTVTKPFDIPDQNVQEPQCFRWVKKTDLNEELFTYPIDQKVGLILRDE